MLVLTEFFFIILLTMMLFILYRNERVSRSKLSPHAIIEECWSGIERRQHVRFKKNLVVTYAVKKNNHLKNNGKTVDVSEEGMKLLLNEKLPKDAMLDLKIDLADNDKAAEVEGLVVWSEDAGMTDPSGKRLFYSGIKFSTLRQQGNKHFSDYIRSIASQVPGR
ncbi:MAG: PilZ domain-containing protein [Candidatus Omnitrophota bacterium]|nr:PilZ domain-containing protein [Candidatus Omnitrophota bacterium]